MILNRHATLIEEIQDPRCVLLLEEEVAVRVSGQLGCRARGRAPSPFYDGPWQVGTSFTSKVVHALQCHILVVAFLVSLELLAQQDAFALVPVDARGPQRLRRLATRLMLASLLACSPSDEGLMVRCVHIVVRLLEVLARLGDVLSSGHAVDVTRSHLLVLERLIVLFQPYLIVLRGVRL